MVDLNRKQERSDLKARGLCVSNHSQPVEAGYALCKSCLKLRKDRRDRLISKGFCHACGGSGVKSKQKNLCDDCRDKYLANKYRITIDEYRALPKFCAICKSEDQLAVDHCHTTGKVRGVLCRVCNSVVGLMKESVLLTEGLLRYMKEINEN